MRVAALYDIHANLPALEAVLDELRQADVDQIVVGGDVVPGPMPRQTLQLLLDLDRRVHFLHGNGELAILALLSAPPLPMTLFAVARCGTSHRQLQPTAFGTQDRCNFSSFLCGAPSAAADGQFRRAA
jgi:Calcineurin-like phosphoesterase superfamily domain